MSQRVPVHVTPYGFQRIEEMLSAFMERQRELEVQRDAESEEPPLPVESDDYVAWLDSQLSPDLLELHEQLHGTNA